MKSRMHHKPQHYWITDRSHSREALTLSWPAMSAWNKRFSLWTQSLLSHARNHAGTTHCTFMGEEHNRTVDQAILWAIRIRTVRSEWWQTYAGLWNVSKSKRFRVNLHKINCACTFNALHMQPLTNKKKLLKILQSQIHQKLYKTTIIIIKTTTIKS